MAQEPEHDDRLIRLAYEVRDLVNAGKFERMQQLVAEEAERRGLTPWELTHQLAAVGFQKGIAKPIELVPEGEVIE